MAVLASVKKPRPRRQSPGALVRHPCMWERSGYESRRGSLTRGELGQYGAGEPSNTWLMASRVIRAWKNEHAEKEAVRFRRWKVHASIDIEGSTGQADQMMTDEANLGLACGLGMGIEPIN